MCLKGCCRFIWRSIFSILFFFVFLVLLNEFLFIKDEYLYRDYPDYVEEFVPQKKPNHEFTVVFAVCGVSLSETSRMLIIADYLREHYPDIKIVFYSFGGIGSFNYTYLLDEYDHIVLSPEFKSEEEVERFYRIDRMEEIGDMLPYDILKERVSSELKLYNELKPDVVISGFVLNAKLSTQIANIPYFIAIPLLLPNYDYYVQSLPYFTQEQKNVIKSYVPRRFLNKAIMNLLLKVWYQTTVFKKVALEYGVKPKITSLLNLMEGKKTLVSEIPELIKVPQDELSQLRPGYTYVGPMFAKINAEIPESLNKKIEEVKKEGKKILYFAMGSSGNSEVVKNIAKELSDSFEKNELEKIGLVISPTKRLIQKLDEEAGQKFIESLHEKIVITDILPAPKINSLSDYGILHGGQGTLQTALVEGLPFVGVPSQIEQENNIKIIVEETGSAIFCPKENGLSNPRAVIDSLMELMDEKNGYAERAKEFQKVANRLHPEKIITELILEEIGYEE